MRICCQELKWVKQNQSGLKEPKAPRVTSTACWLLCFLGGSEDPGVWAHSLFSQRPRNPALTPMEPWRSLALLAGSLALTSALVALSTDFWFVAIGPCSSTHSGLWPKRGEQLVPGKGSGVSCLGNRGEEAEGTGPQRSPL